MRDEIKTIINDIIKRLESKGIPSEKIYTDEPIIRTASQMSSHVPDEIRNMRAIERSRQALTYTDAQIFYKQGKLMENYIDDFPFNEQVVLYFPTYKALSDKQLRGYFSWRTKFRNGSIEKTSASFVYLYIYEILNLIGVNDPKEGLQRLTELREKYTVYDNSILKYLNRWTGDFIVYYGLDTSYYRSLGFLNNHESYSVLKNYKSYSDSDIFHALASVSSYNIEKSRFYNDYTEDVQFVTANVYKELSDLYEKSRKNTYFTHLFGIQTPVYYQMFSSAIFCNTAKHDNTVVDISEFCRYSCHDGLWTVEQLYASGTNKEIGNLIHYIDAMMRVAYNYKTPLTEQQATKQVAKIVNRAIQALNEEKKKRERTNIIIDVSKLQGIRDAAAITRDKLIVEVETEAETDDPVLRPPMPNEDNVIIAPQDVHADAYGLTPCERDILHCLLSGGNPTSVAKKHNAMLSVTVDSINEKLFDEFGDTVIIFYGDVPMILEDYAEDLKGVI